MSKPVDVLRKYMEAVQRLDASGVLALFADDAKVHTPLMPNAKPMQGREAFEKAFRSVFGHFKQYRWVDTQLHATGDPELAVAKSSATAVLSDGRDYENDYAIFVRVRNGKLVELMEFFSPIKAAMISQTAAPKLPDGTAALRVAERLTMAIGQKDLPAIAEIWSDDIVVWHSHDEISQTKPENLASLAAAFAAFSKLEYVNIRRLATSDGFVQQHLVSFIGRVDNQAFLAPVCIVAVVKGDRIVRLDEYVDSTTVSRIENAARALEKGANVQ